jgi:predicted RNA-binding Zn-ribbon protein involved in translation (DUF1610 family)
MPVLHKRGGSGMPDREKYIDIFKQIVKANKKYYRNDNDDIPIRISYQCVVDILALLKDQETTSTGKTRTFQCEKCGYGIDDIYLSNEHDFDVYPHFCPNCGRSVKWE